MVKPTPLQTIANVYIQNPKVMLTCTILGFLSVLGISIYRLNTGTSEKQEDIYASSIFVTSILFHLPIYMVLLNSLMTNPNSILFIVSSPIILSLAIVGLNHSNLAYKEERSKVLWIMNIISGLVFSIGSYIFYAMAMG